MSVNIKIKGADGKINTNMDVHYYQNRETGKVDFGYDYKAKLGSEYYKQQSAKPNEN